MPANEDTSNDGTSLRMEHERASPSAESSWRKMSEERPRANPLSIPTLPGLVNGTEESKGAEKRDFRSKPRREAHEKLFRDFFELVLQRAVFQVSFQDSTYIYLFVELSAIILIEWNDASFANVSIWWNVLHTELLKISSYKVRKKRLRIKRKKT